MLYKYKTTSLCLFLLLLLFIASCMTQEEKAFESLKETIEKFNKYKKELDTFYIARNNSKKLTDDISILSDYYSKMILLNDFTWKNAENVRLWKKKLYNSGMLKQYRIPKAFMRHGNEYQKINLELNLRLSILIPRMRKTKYAPGEAKADLTGISTGNKSTFSSNDYYNEGAANIRDGDKKVMETDLKRGPRESSPVSEVHKKYFN